MSKNPWFKFYPTDWKADNQLKLCSAASRGLWIEMLCICHQAKPYGHFLIDESAPTETELSVMTGIPTEQIPALIGELSSRGIFSRTAKGVIYSRKMVNDEKKSREGKKHIKKRWKEPPENKEENPIPNRSPSSPPKTQKPEARSKIDKRKKEPPDGDAADPQRIVYAGRVLKFNLALWDKVCFDYGLDDKQLSALLDERDPWLAKLDEDDTRRMFWFQPTINWIESKIEGIKKST